MGASLTMIDRHYGHLAKTAASTRSRSSTPSPGDDVQTMDTTWTRKKDSLSAAAP
jgi:hypothetical protein